MSESDTASAASSSAGARVIESASASTACQTCDSKFAYILTGGVLGVIALIMMALVLLLFTAIGATRDRSGNSYGWEDDSGDYYRYDEDGWDDDGFEWSSVPGERDEAPLPL